MSQPENPYDSPHTEQTTPPARQPGQEEGDATGGMIPYKNMPALMAYYLGLAGLLPCVGILFSVPAFVLGIMGLRKRAANPVVKGSVHAWIGIVLGSLMTLIWGGSIVMMFLLPLLDH